MSSLREGVELLRNTSVRVHDGEFVLISVPIEALPEARSETLALLNGKAPFIVFSDGLEVTLVLEESTPALDTLRKSGVSPLVEAGFRLLTFTTVMDFSVVGFFAEVTRVVAEAGIPILAASSFSRDHLFVKRNHLEDTIAALRPRVREIVAA